MDGVRPVSPFAAAMVVSVMVSKPKPKKIFWHLFIIFLILSLGIFLFGYFHYKHQVARIKKDKQDDLAAIMELKIQQLINWRQERFNDAKVIFSDQFLARRIQYYLQGKATSALKQEILNRLAGLMIYQYQKIILIGGQGEVKLSYPEERRACDTCSKELVAAAKQSKEIIFSNFYRDDVSNEICLSLLIPISSPDVKAAVGVILLKMDPRQFLYPLIQTWPTPSATAETELLRREGTEVVFLNELRHRPDSALSLRFPLNAPIVCATLVGGRGKGIIDGKDYRGKWVLAAGDHIPDSPWFLVAKVDQQEIFAPIATYVRNEIALLMALVASAGLGLAYVWRNQQAAFYHQQANLAQRYAYLNKYANDIIMIADQDSRLLEANDRAVESYGYERDELLRMSLVDLHPPKVRAFLEEKLHQVAKAEGLVFETSQQRRDGVSFPVEISLNLLEIEGRKFYQAIIRDVTERKQGEKALVESEKSLRRLAEQLMTARETERQRISLLLHDELGQALMLFKFQLSAIRDNLQREKSTSANDCLDMIQYLEGLVHKIRQLSRDLNPPNILEDMGFPGALKYLIGEIGKNFHTQPGKVAIDKIDPLFSPEALLSIYRIFQEALMNIGRHANASQFSIRVKKKQDHVSFMIQDNGTGFDKAEIMSQKMGKPGLGIPSMEERVKILGGSLDIQTKPGAGTKISFNLPIKRSGGGHETLPDNSCR